MKRYPKTWRGWWRLFWLALGCCPIHKRPLSYDGHFTAALDRNAYCFKCEGVGIWPGSASEALRQNYRATEPLVRRDVSK